MTYKTLGGIQTFSLRLPERGSNGIFFSGIRNICLEHRGQLRTWDFHNLQRPSNTAMMFKSRNVRWATLVARIWETGHTYYILVREIRSERCVD